MSKITFKFINSHSAEKQKIERIYNEAFPERERAASFDQLLEIAQKFEAIKTQVAYEDDKIIGFMYYVEMDAYVYLLYFAVNQRLRDGGYGSKLIKSFLEEYKEKTAIAFIETPIMGTSNYEQRVKRAAFYARVNMKMTEYVLGKNAEDMCTVVTSRPDAKTLLYVKDLLQLANQLSGIPLPQGTKLYQEKDGKKIEIAID